MAAHTGFERLMTSAAEQSAATVDDIGERCEETGPARLIFCALRVVTKIGRREHERDRHRQCAHSSIDTKSSLICHGAGAAL